MTGTSSSVSRILIADDHVLFRQALIGMFESTGDLAVVADCGSGVEALDLVASLAPDVAVVDVGMPGPAVVDLVSRIRSESPPTQVIVLTMQDDATMALCLIRVGASAYLLKSCDQATLIGAVRMASRSEDSVSLSLGRTALLEFRSGQLMSDRGDNILSEREREVLALLAQARSNAEIGSVMGISIATVKRHLSNLYNKIGAQSRVDAVRIARSTGLLDG